MDQCAAVTKAGSQCRRPAAEGSDKCGHHGTAKPRGLAGVAASGDRLQTLMALRQVLARAIDDGPPARDLASLSRRLQLVVEEIDEMGGEVDEQSASDDLAARRAARLAAASS